jgi:quercetin dioxygenase-like cupin family protein
MAIVDNWDYMPLAMEDDPDDYRPDSKLALIIDPAQSPEGFVHGLTVFDERIAPGDRIPLHQHTIEEVVFVEEGHVEVRLGAEHRLVTPRAVVFIPAGVAHGFRNVGESVACIRAVFPSREITVRYLERNPAPGTEGDDPQPPVAFDVRELVEGNPADAIRRMHDADFRPVGEVPSD